jgi:hypothetical protein
MLDEHAAMELALRAACERDLVVLLPTDVDGTWQQVQEFAQDRAAARMAEADPPASTEPAHA